MGTKKIRGNPLFRGYFICLKVEGKFKTEGKNIVKVPVWWGRRPVDNSNPRRGNCAFQTPERKKHGGYFARN